MKLLKITPKFKEKLQELQLTTPIQALYFFPKQTQFIEVAQYNRGMIEGVFEGVVLTQPTVFRRGKTVFVRFRLDTNNQQLALICFNQSYLLKVLEVGMKIIVNAKLSKNNWVVSKVYYKNLDAVGTESVYSLLPGMQQGRFRTYIQSCLDYLQLDNFLPADIHQQYKLITRKQAFTYMHFPQSQAEKEQAIRYFKYEEAYLFYLNIFVRKQFFQRATRAKHKSVQLTMLNDFQDNLPFQITNAQQRVLKEIINDINSPYIMHRLVQGDVGSGKTIVALMGGVLQIKQGYQVAFLAPTTILAEQHYLEAQKYLEPLGIVVAFMRSQMKKKERMQIIDGLITGKINMLIGTHAILEEDVMFHQLGCAIIDEQQRFGVEQRKKLRRKGDAVDMLYMSATPIPRTLAMSVFGDLDVSTIDELPSGRQQIQTKIIDKDHWNIVVQTIIDTAKRNEQVYVVCPLIEESETLEVGNILHVLADLQKQLPAQIKLGMLHGKLKNEEKQQIIADFTAGDIHVLVSTTVVEVGVHVDRATLMVIYDAQQFGLSQLHQLRGRVGRSSLASSCLLVSDFKNKRLSFLEKSQDGFFLAQKDLELRGPGDFFGSKQSGIPTFKVLNLVEDFNILEAAKTDVVNALAVINEKDHPDKLLYAKIEQYIQTKSEKIKDYID